MTPMIIYPQSDTGRPGTTFAIVTLLIILVLGGGVVAISQENAELRKREEALLQTITDKDGRIADLARRLDQAEQALATYGSRERQAQVSLPTFDLETVSAPAALLVFAALLIAGITYLLYRAVIPPSTVARRWRSSTSTHGAQPPTQQGGPKSRTFSPAVTPPAAGKAANQATRIHRDSKGSPTWATGKTVSTHPETAP